MLFVRARWGKITYHQDFEDTHRIDEFEAYLSQRAQRVRKPVRRLCGIWLRRRHALYIRQRSWGEDGRMIGDRWGVSDGEILRSYPCDEFVASPALRAWRGVDVQAPADVVWPWVAQVRLAPYSYDWIDNLGRRSPRELVDLPEPQVGDRFTAAGGVKLGRIVSVEPGRQLTGTIMGAFISYVLVPRDQGTTRLLFKLVMRTNRWVALGLSVGDLIMARRQLLNLKRLAEQHQHRGRT